MGKDYRPFLMETIERKGRRQSEAMDMLYDDPTVPRKMIRAINRARVDSFSMLNSLRYASFVSREDIVGELSRIELTYERMKGRHNPSDPDGFGTGVYVDAMQVLREALEGGDSCGD
jgi:hypothetical protein